jgi:hypothetical protein
LYKGEKGMKELEKQAEEDINSALKESNLELGLLSKKIQLLLKKVWIKSHIRAIQEAKRFINGVKEKQ